MSNPDSSPVFTTGSPPPSSLHPPPSPVFRFPTPVLAGVLALATSHNLAPLLFSRLKRRGIRARVPLDVWKKLRLAYLAGAGASVRFYRELENVLRKFRDAGIPVVVLKGAYLAEVVYGDIALRPMCDADIMVHRTDLPKVQTLLLDMGFGPRERADVELLCRSTKGLKPFVRNDFAVEPHWTIEHPTSPFKIDVAGLWARARPAKVAGVDALALSPEDLLLHICLHIAHKHTLWIGLQPLCDIAETIRHYEAELDWTQLVNRAREWGASRYVGLSLALAHELLGAAVPDGTVERLVPGGIERRILEAARESLLTQTGYEHWLPFFDPFGARNARDKARVSLGRVFLSREEMAAIYPGSGSSQPLFPYYLLRLRDVTRTYLSHALKRTRLLLRTCGRDPNAELLKWLRARRS